MNVPCADAGHKSKLKNKCKYELKNKRRHTLYRTVHMRMPFEDIGLQKQGILIRYFKVENDRTSLFITGSKFQLSGLA